MGRANREENGITAAWCMLVLKSHHNPAPGSDYRKWRNISQNRTQTSALLISEPLLDPFPPQREVMWRAWFEPHPCMWWTDRDSPEETLWLWSSQYILCLVCYLCPFYSPCFRADVLLCSRPRVNHNWMDRSWKTESFLLQAFSRSTGRTKSRRPWC